MGDRVLITGYHSFTAPYVRDALLQQHDDVVFTSRQSVATSANVLTCDLQDITQLKELLRAAKPNYIIHLAAANTDIPRNHAQFQQGNVDASENLLTAAAASCPNIKKIILASSAHIYGNTQNTPIAENHPAQPLTDYAESKLHMELMAAQWFSRLPIIITRPFNYTGKGQNQLALIPKLIHHLCNGIPLSLGDPSITRDFSDVRFIAACYAALLRSETHSSILNLCGGHGYSIAEIITALEQISGKQFVIEEQAHQQAIHTLIGDRTQLAQNICLPPNIPLIETLTWMLNI